jgi:hypothetical protein
MRVRTLTVFTANKIVRIVLTCFVPVLGCARESGPIGSEARFGTSVFTQQLASVLRKGMSQQELNNMFGEPLQQEVRSNGTADLIYHWGLPRPVNARVESIGGLSAQFSNDHLISWQPIYTLSEPPVGAAKQHLVSTNRSVFPEGNAHTLGGELAFYVVSDKPIAGGTFIDSEKLPKLGYIHGSPNLEIKHLEAVSVDVYPVVDLAGETVGPTNAGKFMARVSIVLTAQDAKLFFALTGENIGKRILITFDHEPLAAPLVMQPIETGNVQISLPDASAAEEIGRRMKHLVK